MVIIYYNLEDSPLFEPTDLLAEFTIDYAQFSIRHRHWNYHRMWAKFIRSS